MTPTSSGILSQCPMLMTRLKSPTTTSPLKSKLLPMFVRSHCLCLKATSGKTLILTTILKPTIYTSSWLETMSKTMTLCSASITPFHSWDGLWRLLVTCPNGSLVSELARRSVYLASSLVSQLEWWLTAKKFLWPKSISCVFIKIWEQRNWPLFLSRRSLEELMNRTFGRLSILLVLRSLLLSLVASTGIEVSMWRSWLM